MLLSPPEPLPEALNMTQSGEIQRSLVEHLKALTSADAATWLIHEFPINNGDYWRVFELIKHRSWKKTDQVKLCKYYMQNVPFASARPYEVFAQIMSLRAFLAVLTEVLPSTKEDMRLFLYHLKPVLTANVSAAVDEDKVRLFLSSCDDDSPHP